MVKAFKNSGIRCMNALSKSAPAEKLIKNKSIFEICFFVLNNVKTPIKDIKLTSKILTKI